MLPKTSRSQSVKALSGSSCSSLRICERKPRNSHAQLYLSVLTYGIAWFSLALESTCVSVDLTNLTRSCKTVDAWLLRDITIAPVSFASSKTPTVASQLGATSRLSFALAEPNVLSSAPPSRHHKFHEQEPVNLLLTGTSWHYSQRLECATPSTKPHKSVDAWDAWGPNAKTDKQSALQWMVKLSQLRVDFLSSPIVGCSIFRTRYIFCSTNSTRAWCIQDIGLVQVSFPGVVRPIVVKIVQGVLKRCMARIGICLSVLEKLRTVIFALSYRLES